MKTILLLLTILTLTTCIISGIIIQPALREASPPETGALPVNSMTQPSISSTPNAGVTLQATLIAIPSPNPTGAPLTTPRATSTLEGRWNPSTAQYLVLISIDACRPDYLELAEMPNLQTLIENGVDYTGAWVGALESNTPPGHTEMSTGSFPIHNGIMGFSWGDLGSGKRFHPTTLKAINRGEMADIVAESGVPTLAGLIKERYADAIVAAISSDKFYAAQGLGMGPTDLILYMERERISTPQATEEVDPDDPGYEPPASGILSPAAISGHEPDASLLQDPALTVEIKDPGEDNLAVFNLAAALFRSYRPRALLINLPETDEWGHKTGGITQPDLMRQVMEATDRGLGELMAIYREADIFDQTLWIITSDHGMTPALQTHSQDLVRRALGLEPGEWQGGVPILLISEPEQAPILAERLAQANLPDVTGIYARVSTTDGVYTYQAAPTTQATLALDLNDAYLYLLGTYAGRYSPNLVLTTKENVLYKGDGKGRQGAHNLINWNDQHIPLIISGPGVKHGRQSSFPARLVDIAPTIARLMGLDTSGMDGVVLSDALRFPTLEDEQAFDAVAQFLKPLRDALRTSAKNGE